MPPAKGSLGASVLASNSACVATSAATVSASTVPSGNPPTASPVTVPEPLITIYEPKSYPVLLQYLAQGYSCPRKMLINSDIEIVEVDDNLIRNINTPEEYAAAIKELN